MQDLQLAKNEKETLNSQIEMIVEQLVDANQTFNLEAKKLSLFKAAKAAKERFYSIFPNPPSQSDEIWDKKRGP